MDSLIQKGETIKAGPEVIKYEKEKKNQLGIDAIKCPQLIHAYIPSGLLWEGLTLAFSFSQRGEGIQRH